MAQVPGFTVPLLVRLRPFLSVYENGGPDVTADAAGLGAALRAAEALRQAAGAATGNQVRIVDIRAVVALPDGARFVRTAVVQLEGTAGWRILTWTDGARDE